MQATGQESASSAPAEAGHNSGKTEMTEAEKKQLFFHHFNKINDQLAVVNAAKEEYKRLRKTAKADGLTLADLDFALRCATLEDPSIVPDELKRMALIAEWFALAKQSDLFEDFDDGLERIRQEGVTAGLLAKDRDSHEYTTGSTEAEMFESGWDEAQESRLKDLQSALEKNNANKAEAKKAELIKKADAQADAEEDGGEDPFDGEGDDEDLRPRFKQDEQTKH